MQFWGFNTRTYLLGRFSTIELYPCLPCKIGSFYPEQLISHLYIIQCSYFLGLHQELFGDKEQRRTHCLQDYYTYEARSQLNDNRNQEKAGSGDTRTDTDVLESKRLSFVHRVHESFISALVSSLSIFIVCRIQCGHLRHNSMRILSSTLTVISLSESKFIFPTHSSWTVSFPVQT